MLYIYVAISLRIFYSVDFLQEISIKVPVYHKTYQNILTTKLTHLNFWLHITRDYFMLTSSTFITVVGIQASQNRSQTLKIIFGQ